MGDTFKPLCFGCGACYSSRIFLIPGLVVGCLRVVVGHSAVDVGHALELNQYPVYTLQRLKSLIGGCANCVRVAVVLP